MESSFFECYAKLLKPDFNRKEQDGDFYGSPLQFLGVSKGDAYRIKISLMQPFDEKKPLTLRNLFLESEKNYTSKIRDLNKNIKNIFTSEALLMIFNNALPRLYDNFFDGADIFFNYNIYEKHRVTDKSLPIIIEGLLAIIWAEYKKRGIPYPKINKVNNEYVDITYLRYEESNDKSNGNGKKILEQVDSNDLISLYKNSYAKYHDDLSEYLDSILYRYFGLGTAYVSTLKIKRNLSWMKNSFRVLFLKSPWKNIFCKHGRYINYLPINTPDDPDSSLQFFQNGSLSPSLLCKIFLLIDLNEHLHDLNDGWIMENLPPFYYPVGSKMENPDLVDKVRNDMNKKPTGQLRLFDKKNEEELIKNKELVKLPHFFKDDDMKINVPQQNDRWTIELSLPENILSEASGEAMVLNIQLLYYQNNDYTPIPCELIEEDSDDETAKFKLEIEDGCLNDIGLINPYNARSHAGFTGTTGKGDIVVVFCD